MKMGKFAGIAAIAFCTVAAGCVSLPKSYSSRERPEYPKLGSSVTNFYQVIDTLQPVLRWKDVRTEGQTYDFALWETRSQTPDKSITGTPLKHRKWGKQIYYAQGISRNYYRIPKPLKPDTVYHWSVRIRTGNEVSEWTTFNQAALSPVGLGYAYQFPFGFITPKR